jgi:hypothetical protein
VIGYGATSNASDPLALRVNDTAQIVGVGPTTPPMFTQPAPLRAVSVGPGAVACSGDSGGGILSRATGAVIAVASLAPQTSNAAGSCGAGVVSSLTGPDLADYASLAQSAFSAAGATPIREEATDGGDVVDAGDAAAPADAGDAVAPVDRGEPLQVSGSSCSIAPAGRSEPGIEVLAGIAAAVSIRLRRRRARDKTSL